MAALNEKRIDDQRKALSKADAAALQALRDCEDELFAEADRQTRRAQGGSTR